MSELSMREAQLERLIRQAYNEGFTEGMREHNSSRGGHPWTESISCKKLALILDARIPGSQQS
jgi:hypothetical protein